MEGVQKQQYSARREQAEGLVSEEDQWKVEQICYRLINEKGL